MVQKITKPTVATLLIAYNNVADVERCLASLKKVKHTSFKHIVVLLDNSTDKKAQQAIAKVAHKYPDFVVFKPQENNLGFASGVNKAIYAADKEGADYYFVLNIDTEVMPDALEKLIAAQIKTKAAIVTPLMVFGDSDDLIYYAGGRARPWLGVVQHPRRHQKVAPQDLKPRFVSFANGCAMLIPKLTIKTYGLLFANYFMYYEDTDLCARIMKGGDTLYYEPAAKIIHFTPLASIKSSNALYYLTRNNWLYVQRNLPWWNKLTAIPAVAGFQLYRLCKYAFKREQRRAILQGVKDALFKRYGQRNSH